MTQALNTLLEHAQRQRDEALAALLQAEDAIRRLRAQADQLIAYRDDYRARHPAQHGRAAPIELLRSHQAFMQRLDQALTQQQAQLASAEGRGARLRELLLEKETRVASVRKLLERRARTQRSSDERRQRRHEDEAAEQRQWHRRVNVSALPH
jgi:flagellar FliJ protein